MAGAPAASRGRTRRLVIGGICALILASAGTIALLAARGTSHGAVYQNTFATQAEGWENSSSCFLGTSGYHVVGRASAYALAAPGIHVVVEGCDASVDSLTDVDISVQVQQIKGAYDSGQGVYFRESALGYTGYVFALDSSGVWWSTLCYAPDATYGSTHCRYLTEPTPTAAAHIGVSATNRLEVRAKGSHFEFFVNGVKVGTADDSTYAEEGYLRLVAGPDNESVFSNLVVTTLS